MTDDKPNPDTDIFHPAEIAALLTEGAEQQVRLELHNADTGTLSLPIIGVDSERGVLRLRWPELQATALPTWLLTGQAQAHATLAKIRIDFSLVGPAALHISDDLPEVHLPLPQRLRRHQRRQAFRVAPQSQMYPRVLLLLPGQKRPLRMAAADLCAGGVALLWPAEVPLPQVGDRFDDVELELSRDLRLPVRMDVQHLAVAADTPCRVGFGFAPLPAASERLLLTQLNQLQRRHRLLSAEL
jgi:c-di-GMP-binding flagellar brake protein YcgR